MKNNAKRDEITDVRVAENVEQRETQKPKIVYEKSKKKEKKKMALFGKKKMSLDEILESVKNLSDEEKSELKAKMDDLYKAEDEREIDKVEEEKAGDTETADEKAEDVKDESEEIGKDVDEVKDEVAEDKGEQAEETAEDKPDDTTVQEDKAQEAQAEMVKALTDRVAALETAIGELTELKNTMDEYNRKTADKYGYGGQAHGDAKSWSDMSAAELKAGILNGSI